MKGEIDLEYCSTEKMIADFLTKPLQGKLFQKFWEVIMGWRPISDLGDPGIKEVIIKEEQKSKTNAMKTNTNEELKKNKERVGNGVFFNNDPTKKSYADVVRTQPTNMKVVNKG